MRLVVTLESPAILLESYPNAWLEQLCALNAFCIEFLSSDLRKAEHHLKRASALVETTGTLESIIANNSGHLQLQLGQFAKAEATLKRLAAQSVGEVRTPLSKDSARSTSP